MKVAIDSIDGDWEMTVSAAPNDRVRIEGVSSTLDLRVRGDMDKDGALKTATAIRAVFGIYDEAEKGDEGILVTDLFPLPEREALRVLAVAIRRETSGYELVLSAPAPARHSDIISALNFMGARVLADGPQEEQGFLLNNGAFANRRQALAVAMRAGQLKPGKEPIMHWGLSSEDLW